MGYWCACRSSSSRWLNAYGHHRRVAHPAGKGSLCSYSAAETCCEDCARYRGKFTKPRAFRKQYEASKSASHRLQINLSPRHPGERVGERRAQSRAHAQWIVLRAVVRLGRSWPHAPSQHGTCSITCAPHHPTLSAPRTHHDASCNATRSYR